MVSEEDSPKKEDGKWYKSPSIVLPAVVAILVVVIGNLMGVYFDIINTPSGFVIGVEPIKPIDENTVDKSQAWNGKVITATVYINDLHQRIHPYPYQILLDSAEVPEGVHIEFKPDLLKLSESKTSVMRIDVDPDVKPGNYKIKINAMGGDGTQRSSYFVLELEDESTYQTSYKPKTPDVV